MDPVDIARTSVLIIKIRNLVFSTMDVINDNTLEHNTSILSSIHDTTEGEDVITVSTKNYAKELLKSRIFLGRYMERRLVDKRIGYRDVVVISPAEMELKKNLIDVQHRLHSLSKFHWIGITDTGNLNYRPAGICLWTEIDHQPFGAFWFQIKTVHFRNGEAILKVKCLRHISDAFLELEPILTGAVKLVGSNKGVAEIASGETLRQTFAELKGNLANAFTITNVKEFVTFLFALVIAIFTGSTALITFLGNFILASIREISIFIHNFTPMFLGTLDFFSKIVGGFYILLAMFFKPNVPPPHNRRSVAYYNEREQDQKFDSRYID